VSSDLIIDVSPSEIVIALLENKRLVELGREKSGARFAVGDIYMGKVKKIMPSLNAAFVDVGYEKDAFLHYLDLGPQFSTLNKFLRLLSSRKYKFTSITKIQSEPDINKEGSVADQLKAGQKILVQIAKEPISTKGPRLTSEISIAGRNLVLIPFSDKVSVSQKIKSHEEKLRLKNLVQSIRPKKYGVIIRTAAEDHMVAELDHEIKKLVEKWESTFTKIGRMNNPGLVLGEIDRATALLRDIYHTNFSNIIVNDAAVAGEISEYLESIEPEKKKIVKLYRGRQPIFEHYGIDKQIKASFGKTVSFQNGAYLIIEHTEAMHVIDVNSGHRSNKDSVADEHALQTNLEASHEIARQLRLRDMGGIIVVDFIDMQNSNHRKALFDSLRDSMKTDKA